MVALAVLKKLKKAANHAGVNYSETELTNHTGITVGGTRSTIGRHAEIDDITVGKFYDQYANELGKGCWRS
jgi:hypothetical protein